MRSLASVAVLSIVALALPTTCTGHDRTTAAAPAATNAPPARVGPAAAKKPTWKADYMKSLEMNAPMPTGMARPGMKQGDVKKRAEQKQRLLERMMQSGE
jgi:hypothetical protein